MDMILRLVIGSLAVLGVAVLLGGAMALLERIGRARRRQRHVVNLDPVSRRDWDRILRRRTP